MHPWAAITGLLVLFTDATAAAVMVLGLAGRPITLPCTYSTAGRSVTSMCWGRGPCPSSQCSDTLIWTDGSHVTSRKAPRYMLKGRITEGDVSLTIEGAVPGDSGLYCCRIEHPGWFNDQKITFSLEIRPRPSSSPATPRLTTLAPATPPPPSRTLPQPVTSPSTPATTRTPGPEPQPSTWQEPSPAPPTSSPPPSCPPGENGTDVVTQTWDGAWRENQTLTSLAQNPWKVTSRGLYIGLSVTAAVLVTVLVALVTKKHLLLRRKQQQLSMVTLHGPPMTALQSAAAARVRAEDNIYTVEDNPYVVD
ncbi:hepatitis A virus cellular receptor 1 homolog isoform X1 [Sorex araneus]|uniref:hepatitis A virus cellular receptor 1 homolog isoform X1 n=1 Tax=Sorex araneus TaxID=42254 RepID=UPI0024337970|nr:hepatitis A virus cellular receptor 1 homolog isoform X1 [Sorex araneus]XP_054983839.1 hepatitis A virus cellular receptor 1 homolog isoform X1 [Sorex araneus]